MVTYPLTPPAAFKVASARITSDQLVGVSEGTYSFAQTVYERPGQQWRMDLTFPHMTQADNTALEAFFAALKGRLGTFTFGLPDYVNSGTVTAATFNAAYAVRVETITVFQAAASDSGTLGYWNFISDDPGDFTFGAFAVGDVFEYAGHLHRVTEAGAVTSAGLQEITIWPGLRTAATEGAALVIDDPKGTWRLSDATWGYDIDRRRERSRSISVMEAL